MGIKIWVSLCRLVLENEKGFFDLSELRNNQIENRQ